MNFDHSDKTKELIARVEKFMDENVYPNESVYEEQMQAFGENRWQIPQILEDLKEKAKAEGLWNLFLPESDRGAGLTNVEYIDTTYSNVYSTYNFGNGEKKFAGYGITIPAVDEVVSDPEVIANDTTYSLNTLAEDKTGVKGWRIVRFLPLSLGRWYTGNYLTSTNMEVTASIGIAYDYTNEFMVPFGTVISAISPTSLPIKPFPIGELAEIFF